jgi:hypothetical protein
VIRFALTWLAAWCQVIAIAALPLGWPAVAVDPLGNAPICHADADGEQPTAPPAHLGHDCVLCVICQSHAATLAILAPTPAIPHRQVIALGRWRGPQPRAPPRLVSGAAQPRGPPSLV